MYHNYNKYSNDDIKFEHFNNSFVKLIQFLLYFRTQTLRKPFLNAKLFMFLWFVPATIALDPLSL